MITVLLQRRFECRHQFIYGYFEAAKLEDSADEDDQGDGADADAGTSKSFRGQERFHVGSGSGTAEALPGYREVDCAV